MRAEEEEEEDETRADRENAQEAETERARLVGRRVTALLLTYLLLPRIYLITLENAKERRACVCT